MDMQCHRFSLLISILLFLCFSVSTALDCELNLADPYKVAYSVLVDQSGAGNFTTVQSAIDSVPSQNSQWIRIQISSGIYTEKVTIPEDKPCIYLEGGGSISTFIQWGDHAQTDTSATFTSQPDNIVAKGITFKNTFNAPVNLSGDDIAPAVAARVYGDKSAFYHCAFVGLQDTLFDVVGRHYFYKSYIEGVIDFIFGSGQSIYEKCVINIPVAVYPGLSYGYITAQGRNSSSETDGFVFKNCTIEGSGKAYLGRAYGAYSRVIFYESELSDIVEPVGWDAWNHEGSEEDFMYAEVDCYGAGADTSGRVPWLKKWNASDVSQFLDISYIDQEGWISELPTAL